MAAIQGHLEWWVKVTFQGEILDSYYWHGQLSSVSLQKLYCSLLAEIADKQKGLLPHASPNKVAAKLLFMNFSHCLSTKQKTHLDIRIIGGVFQLINLRNNWITVKNVNIVLRDLVLTYSTISTFNWQCKSKIPCIFFSVDDGHLQFTVGKQKYTYITFSV